jgi:hypothetical protein
VRTHRLSVCFLRFSVCPHRIGKTKFAKSANQWADFRQNRALRVGGAAGRGGANFVLQLPFAFFAEASFARSFCEVFV